jgi:hypothetical protein
MKMSIRPGAMGARPDRHFHQPCGQAIDFHQQMSDSHVLKKSVENA